MGVLAKSWIDYCSVGSPADIPSGWLGPFSFRCQRSAPLKASAFEYHRPSTIEEVTALLASLDDCRLLAGGQSLLPMLNFRVVAPAHVVDLNHVPELSGIEARADGLSFGAMTRQRDIEFSPLVVNTLPLMAEAIREVGHRQTRNRGTIGGSLCHLDPSAELPVVAAAMDASLRVRSRSGERWLPFQSFCGGYMTNSLAADEVLCEIRFPAWPAAHGWSFMEFARRKGDYAIVSIAALAALGRDGRVQRCAIALGGIGAAPVRVTAAEALLVGSVLDPATIAKAAECCAALPAGSDPAVPAWYRQQLAGVLGRRALAQVSLRARDGQVMRDAR